MQFYEVELHSMWWNTFRKWYTWGILGILNARYASILFRDYGVLMVGHVHYHQDTYIQGVMREWSKIDHTARSCSIGLSIVPCSYGRVACSARHYVHKAYTLGVLGTIRCYIVDIWPMFLYGIAVSHGYDLNRGRFYSLGGVKSSINTLVHICRHYGVSTNVLR